MIRWLLLALSLSLTLKPNLSIASINFLTIADLHYNSQTHSGDGYETDDDFLSVAMNKYSSLTKQVDFILTLGDLPAHIHGFSPLREEYEKKIFQALYQANTAHKPLFYITGNNDALQGNYQPFNYKGKSPLNLATDWQGACAYCRGLMVDGSHLRQGGYYTSHVINNNKAILLIALNSVQFTSRPIFQPAYLNQQRDALAQLNWFAAQLAKAQAQQVIIAMHIPPGNDFLGQPYWQAEYQQEFIKILQKYYHRFKQITLITAHSHMDEIRKIHLFPQRNIYAFSCPSLSQDHYNYAAMKIFHLNDQLLLADFTTYLTRSIITWEDETYRAIRGKESIFPICKGQHLTQCLNNYKPQAACQRLEEGFFYGVKSDRVAKDACKYFYAVNELEMS